MISLKKHKDGKPIALIIDGDEEDGKVYLYEKEKKEYMDKNIDILDFIDDNMFWDKKARKHVNPVDMGKIIKALKLELDYILEDNLEETFQKIRKYVERKRNTEIKLHGESILQFIPNEKITSTSRHVIFVVGQGGSGKSFWCASYAKRYLKMFKKSEVYIFSQKDKDEAYDNIMKECKRMHRVILDETYLEGEERLSFKDFDNTLLIFDDVQCIEGSIGKEVRLLRKEALELGRSHNISVCMTEHIACDGEATKGLINESTHYVFFRGANHNNTTRLLEKYIGFQDEKEEIPRIFDLPSRWKLISKEYPKYVMYESGCYIFK